MACMYVRRGCAIRSYVKQFTSCCCGHGKSSRINITVRPYEDYWKVSRYFGVSGCNLPSSPVSKYSTYAPRLNKHCASCIKEKSNCGPCSLYDIKFNAYPRHFHSSVTVYKDESIVEKTVKALKEKTEKDGTETPSLDVSKPETKSVEKVPKASLLQRFWAECKHYYHGFRLLFLEIRLSSKYIYALLNGKSLTRRERKQLIRTIADIFRLVPFLVFIIVPFMEFLLPVALKLFPGMLPSTFKEENKELEKQKKNLKIKLEMAKFLQDTIEESALQSKNKKTSTMAEEFSSFINKIRTDGVVPTNEEIVKFSKLFEDEMTLENMSRQTLVALCKVLNLSPMGTDPMIRFQLEFKLRRLLADDKIIQKEGLDKLSTAELQAAVRARGMRAMGVSQQRLKFQLEQWLDLHLNKKIPTSLLLMSRALYLPEELSTEEKFKAVLSALPESTTNEAKIKMAEIHGERVDNKAKAELIKQQEEQIKKEKEAREKEEQKAKAEAEKKEAEKKLKEEKDVATVLTAEPEVISKEVIDIATPLELKKEEEIVDKAAEITEDERITQQELEGIEDALEDIVEARKRSRDKSELEDLKEDVKDYQEDLQDLKAVIVKSGMKENTLRESKAAQRLAKSVEKLITQLDHTAIEVLYDEKNQMQEEIEIKEVKMKHSEDEKQKEEMMQIISEKKDSLIDINEMLLALKRLQRIPDETRLQRIVEVLDEDKDGHIDASHVLKVIEVMARDNVKLNPEQVTEMIDLVKKEAIIEVEEKMKEKEEKKKEDTTSTEESPQQAQGSG